MPIRSPRHWMQWALLNFFVAAVYGILLRYAFVEEIPGFEYRHFLHAHSHVGMLGWVYQALFALLVFGFLPQDIWSKRYYRHLYLLSQGCVIGMAITFPIFGYHPWSIIFSTGHVIFSYAFAYVLIRDKRQAARSKADDFLFAALAFMLISTLALWSIGILIALQQKGSILYYAAVQFYLHFQFNGWFTFAVLALLLLILERQGIILDALLLRRTLWLLLLSCMLSFALVLAWLYDNTVFLWTNGAGVILQAIAAVGLFFLLRHHFADRSDISVKLWLFAAACYALKVGLQLTTLLTEIATVAATIRNFVIGFFHLLLLGTVSMFIIGAGIRYQFLRVNGLLGRVGLVLLILGFTTSELLLLAQGLLFWKSWGLLPYYYESLLATSLLLMAGIGFFLFNQFYVKLGGKLRLSKNL